jgi:hypothetical protein
MYNLTKEEKINFILKTQKELQISANTISKNTKLTESGVQRILKGTSKNPQENSLNQIIDFFITKVTGSELNNELLKEPKEDYTKIPKTEELQQDIINLYKEISALFKEKTRLEKLLEENQIKY